MSPAKMSRAKFTSRWHYWIFILSLHQFLSRASPARSEGNTIRYQTNEEGAPGTVIGNLAKDMSLASSHSRNNFRMMKQFNDSFVRVRESDGELTVGERIDRERLCRHTPQCLLTFDVVNFSKDRYKLIHVAVEIRDVNDNSPEFPSRESVVEISENAAVGSRIPLDPAVDADVGSNYIQSYQISVNSHFTIDVLQRADGVKYAELVLMKELDRESQSSYTVDLVATDGGNPYRSGSTKITIKVTDFNDNSPVFDQNSFSVTLPEDAPVGTLILDLNAVDADEGSNGEVVYGYGKQVSHEIRQLFQVDAKSGRLTLRSAVDFEDKSTYEFDVQAHDLGANPTPSACKIVVHVLDANDNAPEISITPVTPTGAGVAHVSEAAERDSLVALISTSDRDSGANGRVRCALYGHEHFRLRQAYEDSYVIVTAGGLDRERVAEYNLTVTAEDSGSPPLRRVAHFVVRVGDENDNPPRFARAVTEVAVAENNPPGAYIATVEATDADLGGNGRVTYRLLDGGAPAVPGGSSSSPINTYVSLNSASGAVYALRSFNYEVTRQLDVHVQATDGGQPRLQSTAVLRLRILDQNDNPPTITAPPLHRGGAELLLPRDAPAGYLVTQVKATDADEGENARLSYRLAEGAHLGFILDSNDGRLRVSRQLSYEAADSVRLTVAVTDGGQPTLTATAVLHLSFVEGTVASLAAAPARDSGGGEALEWDASVAVIVVLAGSCSLLLLAIVLITTTCGRRGRGGGAAGEEEEKEEATMAAAAVPRATGEVDGGRPDMLTSGRKGRGFDSHPFPENPPLGTTGGGAAAEASCEEGRQATGMFEPNARTMEGKLKASLASSLFFSRSFSPLVLTLT